jgi:hypothetical protein
MKYESPITYHSKDIANVKVFADRQTDGQAKKYMPLIFRYGSTKIGILTFLPKMTSPNPGPWK